MHCNLAGKEHVQLDTKLPEVVREVVYPSKWFTDSQGSKPVAVSSAALIGDLYKTVKPQLLGGKWEDDYISAFMIATIEANALFHEVLDDDWKAQGLTIGDKGGTVNPTSCLAKNEKNLQIEQAGAAGQSSDHLSLFAALAAVYRRVTVKGSKGGRVQDTVNRIQEMLEEEPYCVTTDDMDMMDAFIEDRCLTVSYMRVICALDMFYIRFPQGTGSKVRVSTMVSRYRGCTAITSMTHTMQVLSLKADDLLRFMLHKFVAEEAVQTFKEGEYSSERFGYFPYQLEMKLTPASPYTLTANPSLTFYMRCLATIGGSTSAPLTYVANGVQSPRSIIEVAFLVATRVSSMADLSLRFGTRAELDEWKKHQKEKDDFRGLSADKPQGTQVSAGVQESTWSESVAGFESRKALSPVQTAVDDIINHLEENKGLSHEAAMRLYRVAKGFAKMDPGTVGNLIYENYGKSSPVV